MGVVSHHAHDVRNTVSKSACKIESGNSCYRKFSPLFAMHRVNASPTYSTGYGTALSLAKTLF
jgi:hypothetical protein